MTQKNCCYAKTHEWVAVETGPAGEKIATVGLSDFALQALTDLVFMQLPPVGRKVARASRFGEIESVKAVSDIYSPVDGEVAAANTAIVPRPCASGRGPLRRRLAGEDPRQRRRRPGRLMDYETYQKQ